NRITLSATSSQACQNRASSWSASTRSRDVVALRSMPRHGLTVMMSCRCAQLKIALAEASTWLRRIGAVMNDNIVRTSARVTVVGESLPHFGSTQRLINASACRHDLFFLQA